MASLVARLKLCLLMLKKANCGPVDIFEIGGNLTIDGNVVETIDGKIPDWKQVIPKAEDLSLDQSITILFKIVK